MIILGRQGIHQIDDLRKPQKVHTTVKISLCMKQTFKNMSVHFDKEVVLFF